MSTLHFQVVSHAAFLIDEGEGMINEMFFEHLVDKRQITLFNKADFLEDTFLYNACDNLFLSVRVRAIFQSILTLPPIMCFRMMSKC